MKQTAETDSPYKSLFIPSSEGLSILTSGKILAPDETPSQMIERVVSDLSEVEKLFNVPPHERNRFADNLGQLMDEACIVMSTPIMTNAGRFEHRPLSACTVPPVDLRGDLQRVKGIVDIYHQEAMGTGFDLTHVEDPLSVLIFLNEIAVKGAASGKEDRPVGNMATLRIDHPRIKEFITAKVKNLGLNWKFNISVDIPQKFWRAVKNKESWILADGRPVDATELFRLIAQSAYICADPGIICLDRLNADNPLPCMGSYSSVAPCAEVGLIPGETCQFGYLNLAKFLIPDSKSGIDYQKLSYASQILVRSLDDALELSIHRYSSKESAEIMSQKRKIGVGVCGLADMFAHLGIPYDSNQARILAKDLLAFINYQTKRASVDLSKHRGSFGAMNLSIGNRYRETPGFIENKYGQLNTQFVSTKDWCDLGEEIRQTKLLRNCSTVALPPTGRSGLVVGASTGIEPLFTLAIENKIHPALAIILTSLGTNTQEIVSTILNTGSCQTIATLPEQIKKVFQTATEISPPGHISMVAAIQPCVDESISKTINLPNTTTVEDIENIYNQAYDEGLKGMTIYRNGSHRFQPRKVVF